MGKIGDIKEVSISELRGAKVSQMSLPLSALKELKMKNLIGVAKASFVIKEEHSNKITNLCIKLP